MSDERSLSAARRVLAHLSPQAFVMALNEDEREALRKVLLPQPLWWTPLNRQYSCQHELTQLVTNDLPSPIAEDDPPIILAPAGRGGSYRTLPPPTLRIQAGNGLSIDLVLQVHQLRRV